MKKKIKLDSMEARLIRRLADLELNETQKTLQKLESGKLGQTVSTTELTISYKNKIAELENIIAKVDAFI